MSRSAIKEGLHPRNRFRNRYDFAKLIECLPALAAFVSKNAHGDESINYGNADAVKALNQALLKHGYDLSAWDIPPGYLCPAVPGRSDYLHHLADLLATSNGTTVPLGSSVRALDIGVGANCIYPLIGACEYGWRFVGSEIDPVALRWAKKLVDANSNVADLIECRLQPSVLECFKGVVGPDETFDLSMCNPPFHASAEEAAMGNQRRSRNLTGSKAIASNLSFGGKGGELWCPGGELAFLQRMISQSTALHHRCRWFTTLVSKSEHLSHLQQSLKHAKVFETKIIEMAQGNKKTRILAWSFMKPAEPFAH